LKCLFCDTYETDGAARNLMRHISFLLS
jgi:hypothetical protein